VAVDEISLAVTGQVAADGTFSQTFNRIAPGQWALVLITLQHRNGTPALPVGVPNWNITVSGDNRGLAIGPQVEIGPRVVGPNASLTIMVTGGLAGASVQGSIHGIRAATLDEVLSTGYQPAPNQLTHGVAPRAFDWQVIQSLDGVSSAPSMVVPAKTGFRVMLVAYTVSLSNDTGVAATLGGTVTFANTVDGTILWAVELGIPATLNAIDKDSQTGLSIVSMVSDGLTIRYGPSLIAHTYYRLAAGGFYI
jgi:hypothetical protein